jgi:hypothetical protein
VPEGLREQEPRHELDNEENYLIKKLCTGLGIVQVENQARI